MKTVWLWTTHYSQFISDFDILAAATAPHHDLAVLTFNTRHFSRIQGLTLHPTT